MCRSAIGPAAAEVACKEVVAVGRPSGHARRACAARSEAQSRAVAGDDRDVRPDALDDARAFVAEHRRQRHRVPLVAHDEVGVTDAGRRLHSTSSGRSSPTSTVCTVTRPAHGRAAGRVVIPPEHLLDLRARVRLRHTLVDQRGE